MATTSEDKLSGTYTRPNDTSPSSWRRGSVRAVKWFIAVFGVLALLAGAVTISSNLFTAEEVDGTLTHKVGKTRLLITVTEDGNVESASNVDVKCQVAGGGTILSIVEDGKQVEEGEVIVRLDQSGITDQLNTQKIAYEKAMAAKIQAEEDFAAAQIAVKEYQEGTYVKELQAVESQITIALENLRSAQSMLAHTERMSRKGFATTLQLEADQFAVQRAKIDLEAAKTAKTVLEKFTREKTLKGLESTRDAAEARKRSEQAAFELEKGRLERLQRQLEYCIIKAPQAGMVIYANETGRSRSGQQTPTIEEGALVREQQTLIRLPNLKNMQVKVTVHESKVDQLRPGMPARITIQDRSFNGKVVSIANQPEPGGWMSSNVKEYATIVSIEGETTGLKPGMTAEVEILVADVNNAITVPVSAVVEQRGKFYAWVRTAGGPERRPLLLGKTNDKLIEIRDGLKEGDEVLLNPRAVVAEARVDDSLADADGDVASAFGSSTGAAAGGDAAPASQQDRSTGGPGKAADDSGGNRSPGEGRAADGKGKGSGRRRGTIDFSQLDKDGDGKLTRDETPEQMRLFFDQIDANADGFVDRGELTKALAEMRRRMGGAGGASGDAPGSPGGPPR